MRALTKTMLKEVDEEVQNLLSRRRLHSFAPAESNKFSKFLALHKDRLAFESVLEITSAQAEETKKKYIQIMNEIRGKDEGSHD